MCATRVIIKFKKQIYVNLYVKSIFLFFVLENKSMTLSINVGAVANSLNIFFSIATVHKFENLSCVILFLRNVLILFKVLIYLSLETVVTGIHKINCNNFVSSTYSSCNSAKTNMIIL